MISVFDIFDFHFIELGAAHRLVDSHLHRCPIVLKSRPPLPMTIKNHIYLKLFLCRRKFLEYLNLTL